MSNIDPESFMLHKINNIESRLESHVTKIEQKLDQLVVLMQSVSALQEKESRNAAAIVEAKENLKDSIDRFDKSVERIHIRLDKIDDESEKDMNLMFTQVRTLDEKINSVDEKTNKWMNRGIGLWIGVSGLVVVLQAAGGFILSSFKDEYNSTKTQMAEIIKRQNELDQDIARIANTIRNLQSTK